MAESSLDDFFAKKDKSKKKTKSKPGATGDVDDSSAKVSKKVKKKKETEKQGQPGGSSNVVASPSQEDEEWKDFEEERKADYSGLRIQTLQISKEDHDREGADGGDGADGDDDGKERRDGASGPWNKSGTATPAAPSPSPQPDPVKEDTTPKAPAKYVPPAQRQGASSTTSSTSHQPTSRKKKEAPNVNSEEDFPTLLKGPGSGKGQQYSSTASSDLMDHPNQRRVINLTLENKFSALQD